MYNLKSKLIFAEDDWKSKLRECKTCKKSFKIIDFPRASSLSYSYKCRDCTVKRAREIYLKKRDALRRA